MVITCPNIHIQKIAFRVAEMHTIFKHTVINTDHIWARKQGFNEDSKPDTICF